MPQERNNLPDLRKETGSTQPRDERKEKQELEEVGVEREMFESESWFQCCTNTKDFLIMPVVIYRTRGRAVRQRRKRKEVQNLCVKGGEEKKNWD